MTPNLSNNILVSGATGNVGSVLVRTLSSTSGVRVRALTRDPKKPAAQALAALPNVDVVAGDMADVGGAAFEGVERAMVISTSEPRMQDVQCAFVDAGKRAGVKHFVKLSGIIADTTSPFRFARQHGAVEEHLAASAVPTTNLRAGEFMHAYFRQVAPIRAGTLPLPMGDARIASIDVDDVARAAAAVLTSPIEKHAGKNYLITGPEALSMADVAARLTTVMGRPVKYVDVPPEAARKARLDAGIPPFLADALDELFAERRAGKESAVSSTLPDVFGFTGGTLLAFFEKHAATFRG